MLTLALSSSMAMAGDYDPQLQHFGEAGGFIGGSLGVMLPHIIFWMPVGGFIVITGMIIGFYFMKFEQKDRGVGKTVLFSFVGLIVGVIAYTLIAQAENGLFDDTKTDCSTKVIKAYIKDSVKMSQPGYKFGTAILATGCFNQFLVVGFHLRKGKKWKKQKY